MYYLSILPLYQMYADPDCRYPQAMDVLVSCLHQGDTNPNFGVSTHLVVGLPPIVGKAHRGSFQQDLWLHNHKSAQ